VIVKAKFNESKVVLFEELTLTANRNSCTKPPVSNNISETADRFLCSFLDRFLTEVGFAAFGFGGNCKIDELSY
jgi:hypothetical protein